MRGLGKYRLAPGFDSFLVEPTKWNKMSVENQEKHVKKFLNFKPSSYNSYMKSKTIGLKSSPRPKRSRQPEPELFNDRIDLLSKEIPEKSMVSPVRLKKSEKSIWQVYSEDRNTLRDFFCLEQFWRVLQFLD